MRVNAALFSSDRIDWETPVELFDYWNRIFSFTIDVCAYPHNAKLPRYWTEKEDALAQDWSGERCWCNPPYGRVIGQWVQKAAESAEQGALVVMLLPARVDSRWWQTWVQPKANYIWFHPGRVRFVGAENDAGFPSAIAVYLPRYQKPKWGQIAEQEIDEPTEAVLLTRNKDD